MSRRRVSNQEEFIIACTDPNVTEIGLLPGWYTLPKDYDHTIRIIPISPDNRPVKSAYNYCVDNHPEIVDEYRSKSGNPVTFNIWLGSRHPKVYARYTFDCHFPPVVVDPTPKSVILNRNFTVIARKAENE